MRRGKTSGNNMNGGIGNSAEAEGKKIGQGKAQWLQRANVAEILKATKEKR